MEFVEKYRTPAACYVYRNRIFNLLHASGVLCVMFTYRSAGAGIFLCLAVIDILLRWNKEVLCIVLGLNLVVFNGSDEPTSCIELTFEKNCPNFSLPDIKPTG